MISWGWKWFSDVPANPVLEVLVFLKLRDKDFMSGFPLVVFLSPSSNCNTVVLPTPCPVDPDFYSMAKMGSGIQGEFGAPTTVAFLGLPGLSPSMC